MSDETDKFDEVISAKVNLVGKLVQDASEENKFYAFVQVTRNKMGFQSPSNYKLRRLSESFAKQNIQLSFILVENGREDIQGTIKTTLFRFFPDIVRNAFISPEDQGVTVWVEPKKTLTREEEEAVASKVNDVLQVLEIQLDAVRITSSENLPTRTACLNVIRLKSPLTQEELQVALVGRGFHIPNEEWLSKMLDKVRRTGFVSRRKNGQFMLTLSGLRSLGSEKKQEKS